MSIRSFTYSLQRLLMRPFLTAHSKSHNLKLRFKTEDVVGRYIYKYDTYEPETTAVLLSEIHFDEGDIVLDIGANIGWYSLLLAREGARVHAFEPDPLNHRLLNENIGLNGLTDHIEAHMLALSDVNSTLPLYLYPDKNRGRHSLNAMEGCKKVEVDVVRVDDFVSGNGIPVERIKLLKMDIEGHELPALNGAEKTLARIPYLLIEHAPEHIRRGGFDPKDVIRLLDGLGFEPFAIGPQGLAATSVDALLEDDREQNLFWKKRD